MQKRLVVLGSTGSIGQSTLAVAAAMPERLRVVGLAAGNNWELLAEQARQFRVPDVAIAEAGSAAKLQSRLPPGTRVYSGPAGLLEFVNVVDATFLMAAIVGAAGLPATLAAVERGLDVGLANKETLVVAGSLVMERARARGGALIPVDSEHSAIFQALSGGRREDVRRIFLTASGGPFRTWSAEQLAGATLDDALNHPTWRMGPKITIDSATMMNKALEVVEAAHLFGFAPEQIEVLVHPESIVHSMVEFCDGSTLAQLGPTDMRFPIQFALTYPQRVSSAVPHLSWTEARRFHFEPPDMERFPALRLGYEAVRRGGSSGAVLNAANEAAVERFRAGTLRFVDIARATEQALRRHRTIEHPTLDQLLEVDRWARNEVTAWSG